MRLQLFVFHPLKIFGVVVLLLLAAVNSHSQLEDYLQQSPDGRDKFSPEQAEGIVSSLISPYDFSEENKRDPFIRPEVLQPPADLPPHGPFMPLQYFEVGSLRVRAILWSVRQPRALVETPDGKSYTVTLGDRIGNRSGYIALIREGEVVVVETEELQGEAVSSTKVLTIQR